MFNIARNTTLDHLRKMKRQGDQAPVDEVTEAQLVDHRTAEVAAAAEYAAQL